MVEKIENDIHKDAITARAETHAADLEVSCECTLEEFFYGSTKKVCYGVNKLDCTGESKVATAFREIEVKPGMKNGTRLLFIGEGNRPSDKLQGNLAITLTQKSHPKYRRDGDNLVYNH